MPPMNDEQAAAYLAGLFDGEGHIGLYRMASGFYTRQISFCNTEEKLVRTGIALLQQLGLKTRWHFSKGTKRNWSDKWTIYVSGGRKAYEQFSELIPLQSNKKREGLDAILSSYIDIPAKRAKLRKERSAPCEVCGKLIFVSPSWRLRGGGRFCGRVCRGLAQRTRKTFICEQCSAPFEAAPSQNNWKGARFCSARCCGLSKSDRMRGMAKMAAMARWHPS